MVNSCVQTGDTDRLWYEIDIPSFLKKKEGIITTPLGYKMFFMLISTEHEISAAN